MKWLAYLLIGAFHLTTSAQTFPVKNVNDEYVLTNLRGSEKFKNNIKEVIRDRNGLYWFQNLIEIMSFDGINWKSYNFKNLKGRNITLRINEIEVTDDSTIWLATSEGMYNFDPKSENFVRVKQMHAEKSVVPPILNCIYKGRNDFLFISNITPGFYTYNWTSRSLKYEVIDSTSRIHLPTDGIELDVTSDQAGNYWGLTTTNKGVWHYNTATGITRCSWKGELFQFPAKKYAGKNIIGLAYSEKENALWMTYEDGKLGKVYLSTGKNEFFSFHGILKVRTDTLEKNRHIISSVKKDRDGNEWILVGRKYLVKLSKDLSKLEYLVDDPQLLPLGKMDWLLLESSLYKNSGIQNENLLWVVGDKGLAVLKKRNVLIRQIPFDTLSMGGIRPGDYENENNHHNIFFVKGNKNNYFIYQQDANRPKLICFDSNLRVTKALLNDEWRKYPAYFSTDFDPDTLYIALLRPGLERMDFRKVVIKDFKVDLNTFNTEEIKLDFSQKVHRYGAVDLNNQYWLFSNGWLYSYDSRKKNLDSLFICDASKRKLFDLEFVKGSDYPTALHKSSSTFWIAFTAEKELYKINLKTRKIEKVIKSCFDQVNCEIPTQVVDLYAFDSTGIYLNLGYYSLLINVKTDSVTYFTDLFDDKIPVEMQIGSGKYKNRICQITESEINIRETVSGKLQKLTLNKDFKWKLSQFNCGPLVNEKGELVLMSSVHKGFLIFNLDSTIIPEKPGKVHFSFIRLDNKNLLLDSLLKLGTLTLKYNGYNSMHFGFSEYSLIDQDKIRYEYTLYNGGDTAWNRLEGEPEFTLTKISPGNYTLLLRAENEQGEFSREISSFNMVIIPPFWQTGWFKAMIIAILGLIVYGIYRYRMQQLIRMQTVRNNIASDLHDDIGSTLNSISVYTEVAKQQAGKDLPALDLIGTNSRKIIESMSDIVWTINPENDSFEKIIVRMRSFAYQLLKAKNLEFTFEVDERLNGIKLPMLVRKNFYLVFKESITNLVKYSGATRVAITLTGENKTVLLQIRDNGKGIPENAETQGNGLMNMKRRAKEINASLNIHSGNGEGTGIELILKT